MQLCKENGTAKIREYDQYTSRKFKNAPQIAIRGALIRTLYYKTVENI